MLAESRDRSICLISTCALLMMLPATGIAAERIPLTIDVSPSIVSWSPADGAGTTLTVSGPEGYYHDLTFGPHEQAAFAPIGAGGERLEDGIYNWEIVVTPELSPAIRARLEELRDTGQDSRDFPELRGALGARYSGQLRVADGSFFVPQGEEAPPVGDPAGPIETQDVLHYDDVIVTGSLCVGFDCVNGEAMGYDTVRLKENNLRIRFMDTSVGTFPTNDWMLAANSTTSGGASYFAIEDIPAGRTPFKIEAGAPANALYVEDHGRIGCGTSVPYTEIHMADGDTPTLRLDQDGTSGWVAQVWDLAGNETNFFIRDATHGSKMPVRIEPNTPSNTLALRSTGRVGIGTWSPAMPLEIETTGENAAFRLERTDGGAWTFSVSASGVAVLNMLGTGGSEVTLRERYDADGETFEVQGSVAGTQFVDTSSRALKTDFAEVDSQTVLRQLADLPVHSWRYRSDAEPRRHVGPMAEDFQEAFGLGDGSHISSVDTRGVMFAAIQALDSNLKRKDDEIAELRQRLVELEERLGAAVE